MKISRTTRRAIDKIVATMNKKDREAWNVMAKQDEQMLFHCLLAQRASNVEFDLPGLQKHFLIARLLLEAVDARV